MRFLRTISYLLFLATVFISCEEENDNELYFVSGRVENDFGVGLAGIKIYYTATDYVLSDAQGDWVIYNLSNSQILEARDSIFQFHPARFEVNQLTKGIIFSGSRALSTTEIQLYNWLVQQQLANGLLESTENGNIVSLYDNALAALVFMLNNDFAKAEKVFDYFNGQINSELKSGVGGFSQFRDRNGVPMNHRWMGDNAWMLIALNNYEVLSGSHQYDSLSAALSNWLMQLQDSDGGLFAGYGADNLLLNYKVTEGNIDAYNAIKGYTAFHDSLLSFLAVDRWNATDGNLMAWPSNPPYRYSLDVHSWSYCIFEDYPLASLHTASRFLSTQTASHNQASIRGYDIDEDKDAVFMEGSGQMALAFRLAGLANEADFYLAEMEKILIPSKIHTNAAGFPYSSNIGTGYGNTPLWIGVDTNIAISPGVWYLFAKRGFNPFAVERNKQAPLSAKFWLN